ncbi:hypothetical protein C8Q74DRAFT_1213721 [Fomes fomentarius]|nr:hypothetical protein C8Q74DRAFT_1213721 [Fomes fomentarius]
MYHFNGVPDRPRSIGNLPTELLTAIFRELNPGVPYWDVRRPQSGDPLRLIVPYWLLPAAVCRRWRDVVNTAAEFWRCIDVGRKTEWLELCLQRSGDALVVISICNFRINLAPLWESFLRPHQNRICHIYRLAVHGYGFESSAALLPGPAPQLTNFILNVHHIRREPNTASTHIEFPVIHPPDQRYPKLRVLELRGAGLVGRSHAWSNLESLVIARCYAAGTTPYSLSAFFDVLEGCRALQNLTLPDALAGTTEDVAQERCVSLGNAVRSVVIHGPASNIQYLLSHLHIPVTAWVSLSPEHNTNLDSLTTLCDLIPLDPRIRDRSLPILRTVTWVKVDCDLGLKAVGFAAQSGGKISIIIKLLGEDNLTEKWWRTLSTVQELPVSFPSNEHLHTLVVTGELDPIRLAEYHSTLRWYGGLKHLVLDDCEMGGDVRCVFQALRGLAPQEHEQNVLLCPRLEYIWVRNAAATHELVHEIQACVEWRSAQAAPLKHLRLELNREDAGAIPVPCLEGRDMKLLGTVPDVGPFVEQMRGAIPDFQLRIWQEEDVERFEDLDSQIPMVSLIRSVALHQPL